MYLDDLPDLAHARLVRGRSRGVAIRDGERAVAVAFVADGTLFGADTLVRLEIAQGEHPGHRLADAFSATGARALWLYGGDDVARAAALALQLTLEPIGAAFVRRMDSRGQPRVSLRAPHPHDAGALDELRRDAAPDFRAPAIEVGEAGGEPVGMVLGERLDARWTELRVVVFPAHRGRGYGAALLAAAADRLETNGRRVCAALDAIGGRERDALESAGFRLADYYFTAARPRGGQAASMLAI